MLVAELCTPDVAAAAAQLETVFGFRADGGIWWRGTQGIRLVAGTPEGHGRIDHLALAVPDMDAALATFRQAGARLDADVTPGGPEFIREFWGDGLRFVYLSGPGSARIELCQRITGPATTIGHDHVGLPCHDLPAMQRFFESQGASLIAAVNLTRPEGEIPVRFLAFSGGVVELYQPADARRATHGLWSRLLVPGLAAPVSGPEGLSLAPL